jgi:hypothetical protein
MVDFAPPPPNVIVEVMPTKKLFIYTYKGNVLYFVVRASCYVSW